MIIEILQKMSNFDISLLGDQKHNNLGFNSMCLYIIITFMLWVLLIYPFIKYYTIVILW